MKEVNGSSLFDLGQIFNLGLLPDGPLGEYVFVPQHCITLLREFSELPFANKLPQSVKHGLAIANEIEKSIQTPDLSVTANDRSAIIRHFDQFRTLLFSDLGKLTTIILEEKGGYGVDTLWETQFNLSKGINIHLSKFVKQNFIEAAKCLVLERYTATGFHAMRAVEQVARKYYEMVIGKHPIYQKGQKEYPKGLGTIAEELIGKFTSMQTQGTSSGDLGIIATTIKALCKIYRDPLSHPEIIKLNENQATTTLRQMIEFLSTVVADAKAKGAHFKTFWKRGILF